MPGLSRFEAHVPKNSPSSAPQIPDASELPEFLTVSEVGRIMRLGRSKAYDCVRQGEVPSVRFGRIIRIPRTALEVR